MPPIPGGPHRNADFTPGKPRSQWGLPFEAEILLMYAARAFKSSSPSDIGGIPPFCMSAVGCCSIVTKAAGV